MGLDPHKGFDCRNPVGWKCHFPSSDPPAKVSVTIRKLRGTMFYDHLVTPLLLICLSNQISFRFQRLIETVKLYHYHLFVAVIFRLTRLC